MARQSIHSRYGPLPAEVVQGQGADRPWRATLVEHHPLLSAVLGAVGSTEREAVANLAGAVAQFGSDWPLPPRLAQMERTSSLRFVRAKTVDKVCVDVDGAGQRAAWAVGWRGDRVWVVWHDGGLDGTAWVPASSVHRPSSSLLG